MVRSTLPYLCLWTGLRLILGVPALVRNFDTLTPYFQQICSTDQEILQSHFKSILYLCTVLIIAQLDYGKGWHSWV